MTETGSIDRSPVAKPVPRRRSAKTATVSPSAMARHPDCSRTCIAKLEAEDVIRRRGEGFPLGQGRVVNLRCLRCERRQSLWSAAASEFTAARQGEDRCSCICECQHG